MEDRTQKEIAECGARVREINKRRKELASEIEKLQSEDARLVFQRDREIYAIEVLERTLDDAAREKSWSAQNRPKREGDEDSVAGIIQQVLEKHPDGLNPPALLAEMRRLGFHTNSDNPLTILSTTLYRNKALFTRRNKGHRDRRTMIWCLKKYARDPMENVVPFKAQS